MVCEMTGHYSLLVPLMLVCGLNVALSRRWTLYEEQVPSPIDSPAHQGDFVVDVLERLRVDQVPRPDRGPGVDPPRRPRSPRSSAGWPTRPRRSSRSSTREGRLTGIFTLRDVRLALLGSDWGPLVLADDLATRPVLTVTPDDDLHTALRRLTELNIDEIPVVAPDDPTRLIGLLEPPRAGLGLHATRSRTSVSPPLPPPARPGNP